MRATPLVLSSSLVMSRSAVRVRSSALYFSQGRPLVGTREDRSARLGFANQHHNVTNNTPRRRTSPRQPPPYELIDYTLRGGFL